MALPHATVVQLVNEGIDEPSDLSEFDKSSISLIANNLRRPGGRVVDPNDPGSTIPTPPFIIGAKSQQRLNIACSMIRFYDMIGRDLTASNLQYTPIMSNFKDLWKAICDRKDAGDPDTPAISKALPIMKWTESFTDHLNRCIGVRYVPLSYVIRKNDTVVAICPALAADQPYSELYGSVEGDMIARASFTNGLYRSDNAAVYYKLEEATRTTTYASSIAPFQKKKNGRAAFQALVSQYAGDDKWEIEVKRQDAILHSRKWKGQTNFTLEKFVQMHRNAFVSMEACILHVQFQLPNPFTRVGYLLDGIENNDPQLQAAIALVTDDVGPGGKRQDFEATAAYLIPRDPVAKRRIVSEKRTAAEISGLGAEVELGKQSKKKGIGRSGVHLRYHRPDEYSKLSQPEKKELMEWRASQPVTAGKPGEGKKKRRQAAISAAVAKQVKEELAKAKGETDVTWRPPSDEEHGTSKEAIKAFLVSAFADEPKKPAAKKTANVGSTEVPTEVVVPPPKPSVTLASILRQAKNDVAK